MAAHVPIEVPTISRVSGISATSKMMNGTERKPLMTAPSARLTHRLSAMPPRSVDIKASPSGKPKTSEIRPEAAVISTVSQIDRSRSSNRIGDMAKHLHPRLAGLQECDDVSEMACIAAGDREKQCADGLLLDMVDAAMDETEGARNSHGKVGQQRA